MKECNCEGLSSKKFRMAKLKIFWGSGYKIEKKLKILAVEGK